MAFLVVISTLLFFVCLLLIPIMLICALIAKIKKGNHKKYLKRSLISFVGAIIMFIIIGISVNKMDDTEHNSESEIIETSSVQTIEETETEIQDDSETQSEVQSSIIQEEMPSEEESIFEATEVKKYSEELEKYNAGEYRYITHSDLVKYHANLVGQKFYTIITVDELDGKVIKSNLDDGYMMSAFNCIKDYSYDLKEQDSVAIMGTVGDYEDYGFVGKSLKFDDCMVFAVREDARLYSMNKSDEYFNDFFTVTEEVSKSNGGKITEDEFKNLCERLNYEDILRNPNSYKDKYCKLSGTVSQVIEGWFGSYTIYIKDTNGDIWGCTYSYGENESHLLEGDKVTVYGMCDGTANTKTVLGKQVTMPYVEIEYID